MLQLLPPVSISIVDEVFRPADPTASPPIAEERYGADYAGTVLVSAPTIIQAIEIGCKTTAAIEAQGVQTPTSVPMTTYQLVQAIIFFGIVAKDVPPWLKGEGEHSPKAVMAILCAHRLALTRLDAGKKNSGGGGGISSTPT